MKNLMVILLAVFVLAGCQSTLDRQATAQNDINVQAISLDNDKLYAKAVADGTVTETTAAIKAEQSHKARRLARAMARDADEDYGLPAIPTKLEDEPPADPE